MNKQFTKNKNSHSSQVITNGIYFGQFTNPQPILNVMTNPNLKLAPERRKRTFAPLKRKQSPKMQSPRQENQKVQLFQAPGKTQFQMIITSQPTNITNRSSVYRLRSPTKRAQQQQLGSDEMDNKSIEMLQDIANSQLNRTSRKRRRPQTAGGYTLPTQHFQHISDKQNQYLIQEQIGQGSYGVVKAGINLLTGQKVAIKIYERVKLLNKREYIKREIQILSSLQHINIVQLIDVIYTDTQVQLIMEFAGPLSLRTYLKQQQNKCLQESEVKSLFLQIAKAIDYCHSKNIVITPKIQIHRDIKLENILILDSKIKLIDFGFSSHIEQKGHTFCGTPSYMAPEIILKLDYGKPADIWSLGILLFVLLHGKFPFQGKDQKELFSKIKSGYYLTNGISPQATRLIHNMLRVRTYERFNIKEILKDSWFQS